MSNTLLPNPTEEPVIPVVRAGAILGLGRSASYEAARRGEFPTLRIANRVLVPSAKFLELLGIDTATREPLGIGDGPYRAA